MLRYVDQGGGKRKGAFAMYLEPWHADIFDFIELRKNHGKEEVCLGLDSACHSANQLSAKPSIATQSLNERHRVEVLDAALHLLLKAHIMFWPSQLRILHLPEALVWQLLAAMQRQRCRLVSQATW